MPSRVLLPVLLAALCAGEPVAAGELRPYRWECSDVPLRALASGRPATELSPRGRAALRQSELGPLRLKRWTIARDTPYRVSIIRPLLEPSPPDSRGEIDTHEVVDVHAGGRPGTTDPRSWDAYSRGPCQFERVYPGHGTAWIEVDPEKPVQPTDTVVPLLVTEKACTSGSDATHRIRLLELRQTPQRVGFVIRVADLRVPPGVGVSCVRYTTTVEYDLRLSAPLGNRRVVDLGVRPSRVLGNTGAAASDFPA